MIMSDIYHREIMAYFLLFAMSLYHYRVISTIYQYANANWEIKQHPAVAPRMLTKRNPRKTESGKKSLSVRKHSHRFSIVKHGNRIPRMILLFRICYRAANLSRFQVD